MNRMLRVIPEVKGTELFFLEDFTKDYTDEQLQDFANVYRTRRRDPNIILLTTLAGLLGFAGIQRFLTNNIGLGVLYFLTLGLCFIGTIVDAVNYENIAFNYNRQMAAEIGTMMRR
jgi:TM2 domain-containing membrane protein YozV